jgi:hypothetical protein
VCVRCRAAPRSVRSAVSIWPTRTQHRHPFTISSTPAIPCSRASWLSTNDANGAPRSVGSVTDAVAVRTFDVAKLVLEQHDAVRRRQAARQSASDNQRARGESTTTPPRGHPPLTHARISVVLPLPT